jgi:spoIIIJ-associated protein
MTTIEPASSGSVFAGPNVEAAIRDGLLALGLEETQARIRVLEKGSRGFLGFGSRKAKVELLPRHHVEPDVRALAEGLLAQMGITATLEVEQIGLDVLVRIEAGEDDGLLIGRKGETLEALQHILLRMSGRRLQDRIRALRVDVAGYRARREAQLTSQVQDIAKRVARTGRREMTEPLTPAERRLVHRMLADHPEVETHAGGNGVNQRVIITTIRAKPGRKS